MGTKVLVFCICVDSRKENFRVSVERVHFVEFENFNHD
jgi:hypothetical protein